MSHFPAGQVAAEELEREDQASSSGSGEEGAGSEEEGVGSEGEGAGGGGGQQPADPAPTERVNGAAVAAAGGREDSGEREATPEP